MDKLTADVVIVGTGIAGLWLAKELVDAGYKVILVEQSATIADGATTRNEGWLHSGSYHSVAIEDEASAKIVTESLQFGHRAIREFAPEVIENRESYAFCKDTKLAKIAKKRWQDFEVAHLEIPIQRFAKDGFDTKRINAAFRVTDMSINTRELCRKLTSYIVANGATILMEAAFIPINSTSAKIMIGTQELDITSSLFVIACGTATKTVAEMITGKPFPMRFFKAHMLIVPRLMRESCFYMDPDEAGMTQHGKVTIIGYNKATPEVPYPDYTVIHRKEQLIYDAAVRLWPAFNKYSLTSSQILTVACIKPDAGEAAIVKDSQTRHNLTFLIHELQPGYLCILPGKMTQAPSLAQAVVEYVNNLDISYTAGETKTASTQLPNVTERPADAWLRK